MMHIIIGLFLIALGIWGIFDEWYYVVDFLKGGLSVILIVAGLIAMLAALAGPKKEPEDAAILDTPGIAPDGGEGD